MSWKGNLLVVPLLLLASLAIADGHPVFYIDQGACPFECCTYREWGTTEATKLYAEPKTSSPVVGTIEKGITVKAQTGEVHTKPGKLVVTQDVAPLDVPIYRKGDVLWVYTYLGEGNFRIWYRGTFIKAYVDSDEWGYFETVPDSVWWMKVRTPGGIEGWTNEPDNFSNQDACAG